ARVQLHPAWHSRKDQLACYTSGNNGKACTGRLDVEGVNARYRYSWHGGHGGTATATTSKAKHAKKNAGVTPTTRDKHQHVSPTFPTEGWWSISAAVVAVRGGLGEGRQEKLRPRHNRGTARGRQSSTKIDGKHAYQRHLRTAGHGSHDTSMEGRHMA
ncbi:unnamed protein product, partial [Ectocarpus sp. 4 AP-2014]